MAPDNVFNTPLPAFSRYTLGTGRTHDPDNREHLTVIRMCMEAGIWFHSGIRYGVFPALRKAFDEDRTQTPRVILKVTTESAAGLLGEIEQSLLELDLDRIDVVQLTGNPAVESMVHGSALYDTMAAVQEKGLVDAFCPEVFWSHSDNIADAVRQRMFPGYVMFLNPVERDCSNDLFDLLEQKRVPILALRTLGRNAEAVEPPEKRAKINRALERLRSDSGCADMVEFKTRFSFSLPNVLTTVGGTGRVAHLKRFLALAADGRALDDAIVGKIKRLHREWWAAGGLG